MFVSGIVVNDDCQKMRKSEIFYLCTPEHIVEDTKREFNKLFNYKGRRLFRLVQKGAPRATATARSCSTGCGGETSGSSATATRTIATGRRSRRREARHKRNLIFMFLYIFCFVVEGIITDKECPNYGEEHAGGGGGGVERKTTIKGGEKKTTVSSPLPKASDPPQAIEFDEDYEYSLRGRGCRSQKRMTDIYIMMDLVSILVLLHLDSRF